LASEYAPLVYGRTFEVDFRYLAIPEKFSDVDQAWANQYVMASMRRPERLEGRPRWVLFQNQHYRVFGVICMVKELIDPKTQYEVDITRDKVGRPLHVFAGYVIRPALEADQRMPSYIEAMELLQPLADYISSRWLEKSYDVEHKPYVSYVQFKQPITWKVEVDVAHWKPPHALNSDPNKIAVWPESLGSDLWQVAYATRDTQAICLGLPNIEDAQKSPFLNATVSDVTEYKCVWRNSGALATASAEGRVHQNPTQSQAQTQADNTKQNGPSTTPYPQNQARSPQSLFFEALGRSYKLGSINVEARRNLELERRQLGITPEEAWEIESKFVNANAAWVSEQWRYWTYFSALLSVYWRGWIDRLSIEYLDYECKQLKLTLTEAQRIENDFLRRNQNWLRTHRQHIQRDHGGKSLVSGFKDAVSMAWELLAGWDQTEEQLQPQDDTSLRFKTKDQSNDPKSTEQANKAFFPSDE